MADTCPSNHPPKHLANPSCGVAGIDLRILAAARALVNLCDDDDDDDDDDADDFLVR